MDVRFAPVFGRWHARRRSPQQRQEGIFAIAVAQNIEGRFEGGRLSIQDTLACLSAQ